MLISDHNNFCLLTYCIYLTKNFLSTADIIVTANGEPVTSKEIKSCIHQIQELIVVRLNQAVANKLISSVDYLRESFVGTLERCLNSLEKSHIDSSVHNITSNHLKQVGSSWSALNVRRLIVFINLVHKLYNLICMPLFLTRLLRAFQGKESWRQEGDSTNVNNQIPHV